ncbi:MAG: calcium-binding protein [Rhizobium sp.]|jgi:serralysin|nr:calcium-binding protein [Rhizobium sp.]
MAKTTYKGDNGVDIVNQTQNKDYYNIITKGGDDEISLTLTNTWVDAGDDDDTVTSNVEGANRIDLGGGDDSYTGKGYAKNNRHDEVYGGAGDDTMTIFTRHSDYFGGGGNDHMSSAGYWNLLVGGNGNDTISYMAQDDDKYLKGWGVDLDLGREFARTGEGRKEKIFDFENAEGTSYGDGILGSKGNNSLWGMGGKDDVVGFKGNDMLYGGNGSDHLSGGNGQDELTGGKGKDYLHGGGGADTFIFGNVNEMGKGNKADVIEDFGKGDKIDLSGAGSFSYINDADFSGSAGELRFEDGLLQGDVDGDGKADFEIKVEDVNALQSSDFIL